MSELRKGITAVAAFGVLDDVERGDGNAFALRFRHEGSPEPLLFISVQTPDPAGGRGNVVAGFVRYDLENEEAVLCDEGMVEEDYPPVRLGPRVMARVRAVYDATPMT